jgi:hypothetical protein
MSQGERQRFDEKSQNNNASALTIDHIEMLPPKTMCFEELCPQWSLALISGVSINPYLDIEKGKYCIVGEAHGFRNSAYTCSKCWEYSQSFVSCVHGNGHSGYIITDHELFESIKHDFLQHFNKKHAYRIGRLAKIRYDARKLIHGIRSKLLRFPTYPNNISALS